jgi:hypothetical protein
VDLHDVNSLPPQALLRQTQALQGVAFVAQVFTVDQILSVMKIWLLIPSDVAKSPTLISPEP